MTKKHFLPSLLVLPIIALLMNSPMSPAQDAGATAKPVFDQVADKALQAMKARAEELKIKGVAVVAYSPGETVQSWSSKMVVVGNLRTPTTEKDKGNNLLGIAYTKASEMAETLKNSGSKVRPPLTGEFGWKGGVTTMGKSGRLICAFSGGAEAQDVEVAGVGLAILAEQF